MKFSELTENSHLISIGHIGADQPAAESFCDAGDLPVIPTRNLVLFPQVTTPIKLMRDNSLMIAQKAKNRGLAVGIVCQTNPDDENPSIDRIDRYGVFADVIQIIQLPDGSNTAIIKAGDKFRIEGEGKHLLMPEADISVSVKKIRETSPKASDKEFVALCDELRATARNIAHKSAQSPADLDLYFNLAQDSSTGADLINMVATHSPISLDVKKSMLAMFRLKERGAALFAQLVKHEEMLAIAESMHQKARESFDDQQRRIFLQRQMEAIDHELNGDQGEVAQLRERACSLSLPSEVASRVEKEIAKLQRLSEQTQDYSVQYSYITTLLELPWTSGSTKVTDFTTVKESLDRVHFGLEKIKERVLEQLAVIINNPEGQRTPILCFVGPPGVGKTSLGQSIASALGREYARISLGGVHDEAEIRGHRRTYVGALPGRIIEAIKRTATNNPVIVLDEIDKLGGSEFHGNPSAALLEVLDPEQNRFFHDNYIDMDFDLSHVMFIATANTLSSVPAPLIDRMEVIEIGGYIPEEKVEIARRHIIPRILSDLNLSDDKFAITTDAISAVIKGYTSESGVRQLEKQLYSLGRKVLRRSMEGNPVGMPIKSDDLNSILGPEHHNALADNAASDCPGVATGLAWTAAGGETLQIETSLSPGKESHLTLTGNLGNVMKESAMIALEYVKSHAADIDIDHAIYEGMNIHLHVPEGAIPKDGPSAGITMTASIASAMKGCPVKPGIAMTGEITLRGRILPVGGIREKMLAARRAGIFDIILPAANRVDVEEIEEPYRQGLRFHYIDNIAQGLSLMFGD